MVMDIYVGGIFAVVVVSAYLTAISKAVESSFDKNYYRLWGNNHISVQKDYGHQAQLLMDRSSGAGFASKFSYDSGFFKMRIKLPNKRTKGVITTFYLTSKPVGQPHAPHDELDFEFIGNNGMPYTLSTNIITNEIQSREQQFHLWFDPTAGFHTYQLLWNQHQIVFFVDGIPIRVYKNIGVHYFRRAMHIEGTLWNDEAWVGPVDWNQGPFKAYFQGFNVDGCPHQNYNQCYNPTPAYYWNSQKNWQLSPNQWAKYKTVRKKYMFYDYCTKASHPECAHQ